MHAPMPQQGPLTSADLQRLERLLEAVPAPLEPLDTSAVDGFLCGVLLQPAAVPADRWMPYVLDTDGRPPPAGFDVRPMADFVRRRHAELEAAITRRQWFDPWVWELDDPTVPPLALVQPWVAGFSLATEVFPALMALPSPELIEPLAVLFSAFDPQDLEDADDLLAVIETLEPPGDLSEAVEDLVSSVLRIADVSRPQPVRPPGRPARPGPRRDVRPARNSRR